MAGGVPQPVSKLGQPVLPVVAEVQVMDVRDQMVRKIEVEVSDEIYPPEGKALVGYNELYELAERKWNSTQPLTKENVREYGGYYVVPRELADKATAAMLAWEEASADIEDWLEENGHEQD